MSETAALDAQVLLAHVLAKPRSWILAHPAALLDEYQLARYESLTSRLEFGEPLPYIIGHWEFYGLDFTLSPAVLIPASRDGNAGRACPALARGASGPAPILDVGTGSGCIAVSLALNCPDARILASDISLEALLVARQNVLRHAVSDRVQLLQCDLLPPTSPPFDLLCANLPYIPAEDMPRLSVAAHEPGLALDGGVEGMILDQQVPGTRSICPGFRRFHTAGNRSLPGFTGHRISSDRFPSSQGAVAPRPGGSGPSGDDSNPMKSWCVSHSTVLCFRRCSGTFDNGVIIGFVVRPGTEKHRLVEFERISEKKVPIKRDLA